MCPATPGPIFNLMRETLATGPEYKAPQSSRASRHAPGRHTRKEHVLLKAYPELAPGLELVNSHNRFSQAITATVTDFDPLLSSRLALGRAIDVDDDYASGQSSPIVVMASGDPAAFIVLIPIENQSGHLPAELKQPSTIPVLGYRNSARWKCPTGPVQQICFAESVDEENTYFAARFSQNTTIFRPLYHRMPLPPVFARRGFTLEPRSKTHLNANPLLDIPISLTGGHPHADVTFNPWYQRQLAIVDRCGNWSVWNIHGKQQRRADWAADRGSCGSLVSAVEPSISAEMNMDHFDGWAAVSWVGSVHQLLVCDRRNLAICQLGSQPPEHYCVHLGFERSSEWILDVSRSKINTSHVFVLTTTRVLWLNILSDDSLSSQVGDGQNVSILLSWRHFRDIEDTSLRLTQILAQNELSIVVFSRFNSLAQIFRFSISREASSIPVSISDPFILPMYWASNNVEQFGNGKRDLRFSSILFEEFGEISRFNQENNKRSTLIKFIGQDTDLEVVEGLYSVTLEHEFEQERHSQAGSMIPRRRYDGKIASSTWVDDSDFVVDDADDPVTQLGTWTQQKGNAKEHFCQLFEPPQRTQEWVHQHSQLIFDTSLPISPQGANRIQVQGFDDWISLTVNQLQNQVLGDALSDSPKTLLELLGVPPSLDAIDSNTQSFERFLQSMVDPVPESLKHYRLSGLPLPFSSTSRLPVSMPAQQSDLSISALYDSLVYDWLSPLSDQVPNRLRMLKERMIRSVVTEMMLSRICLVHTETEEREVINLDEEGPSCMGLAPSQARRDKLKSSQDAISSSQEIKSVPAVDPCPESTESLYLSLRRYTSVKPQRAPLKRVTATISHWKVGTDPSGYNWQTTVRTIQDEQSQSEEHSAIRRRRRREGRQRLQLEKAEKQASLPLPTPSLVDGGRMWGSQPDRVRGTASSAEPGLWSSQVKEEDIPLTQVERGVFGSREASRKKMVKERKKRRAAGF
ncbi:hypothetical protein PRK78_001075 [Emydomyces testavorans]|uniref:RNA polymerase I-specific transcription initiation factor RRN6-like protein n=1 Tax=Emydomyces testavorans TaxID=2070801 RepID=A0AAF0DC93_9EURO|nr:hypothetical protein PRK78_001075 [Emydomyces testavorans]